MYGHWLQQGGINFTIFSYLRTEYTQEYSFIVRTKAHTAVSFIVVNQSKEMLIIGMYYHIVKTIWRVVEHWISCASYDIYNEAMRFSARKNLPKYWHILLLPNISRDFAGKNLIIPKRSASDCFSCFKTSY